MDRALESAVCCPLRRHTKPLGRRHRNSSAGKQTDQPLPELGTVLRITLDTNTMDPPTVERLVLASHGRAEIATTTVTNRELEGTDIPSLREKKAAKPEQRDHD
jgi:hypothetical protein